MSLSEPTRDFEEVAQNHSEISNHLAFLYFIVKEKNLINVLELGTQYGSSTKALLQAVSEINGSMTSVDITDVPDVKKWVKGKGFDNWNFIQCDDLDLEWNKELDLLFIDSDHTYDQLKNELIKFVPFVKKDGFIIMHDFNHDLYKKELGRAIHDYFNGIKNEFEFYRFYHNSGLMVVKRLE